MHFAIVTRVYMLWAYISRLQSQGQEEAWRTQRTSELFTGSICMHAPL